MSRIGIFLPKLSRYGGAEGFGFRIATRLAELGHDVTYVCARQETPPPPGVNVITLGRPGPFRVLKIGWFAYAAEQHRTRADYDLTIGLGKTLHMDVVRVGGGPLEVFWNLSKRAWEPGFARTWKMLRRRLSPCSPLIRYIDRKQLEQASMVVAVSDLVRDWVKQTYPALDTSRIQVVYNKPDLERFSPPGPDRKQELRQQYQVADHEKAIVCAGTNFALKGVGPLIRAMHLLPDNHRLFLAGGRNPGKFGALANELGLRHRVTFLGKVTAMEELYAMADLFILPSFYDACSNAVLEALACGLPVLSSATNGSSRFLPPSQVLADPSDHTAMARAIQTTLQAVPSSQGFAWPRNIPCGLEGFISTISPLLEHKT